MKSFNLKKHRIGLTTITASLLLLMQAGCASGGSSAAENSFDKFFDQVQKQCQNTQIGVLTIDHRSNEDVYFLDTTARFYNGKISRESYISAMQASYRASADSAGLQCLLKQLPPSRTQS